ncbi:MAG: hypothetical protein GC161_08120 [Planctomycetaceae bacterium]|nr:hypothetical protein [Planctomycetaceae bacterium]
MTRLPLPLIAFLLTAATRGVVALSRLDELDLERYTASFAAALLAGMPLHPDELPIIGHLRGSAIFGVLLAPLMALFGPSLGVMKLLAVLWSAFAAGLFALVLERAGGRRVAWIGLLAYALAPPAQAMVEVLALGSHADTLPFVLGPLALLLKGRPGDPLSLRRCIVLGLWLGAGALFSMQTWVAYLGVGAVWLRVDPGAWHSRRPLFIALGALPGLLLIPVLSSEQKLVNRDFSSWLQLRAPVEKFVATATDWLRESWLFAARDLAWAGWVLHIALALALGYALLSTRWPRLLPARTAREPSKRELFSLYALIHTGALLGAFSVTQFQLNLEANLDGMGSRYFMPLLPAFLGLIAFGVVALLERAPPIGAGVAGALGAALVAGTVSLLDFSVLHREPPVRSAEFHEFRNHFAHAGGEDRLARLAWVERMAPDWPAIRPMTFVKVFEPRHPRLVDRSPLELVPPDVLRQELAEIQRDDPRVQPFALVSFGMAVCWHWTDHALFVRRNASTAEVTGFLAERFDWLAQRVPPEGRVWFVRGFGRGLATLQARLDLSRNSPGRPHSGTEPMLEAFQELRRFPAHTRAPLAEGMGVHWGLRATPYKRLNERVLDAARRGLSEGDVEPFFFGFAWGYRSRFIEATYRVPDPGPLEAAMSPAAREAFRAALEPTSTLTSRGPDNLASIGDS